ncbi:MAG: threonine/serine exporter family protein [Clostridia bacterium]|nr:threonine/serine exporter family protein [Clostridia bacterium]
MKSAKNDCLVLAVKIAHGMMCSGGETYRAEECCINVLKACGAENISVIAMPTALMVSADVDGEHRTESVSIKSRTVDLKGIELYNSLSRKLVSGELDETQAFAVLEQKQPPATFLPYLFGSVSAAFFSVAFGGTVADLLPAFITAIIAQLFKLYADRLSNHNFISVMGSCMITALCARLIVWLFPACSQEAIIVGGIISMLPGLAITNAVRDTINGDLLSGVSRFADALLTAIVIAAGVAIVISA